MITHDKIDALELATWTDRDAYNKAAAFIAELRASASSASPLLVDTVRKMVEDERHPMADYVRAELEAALLASSAPPANAYSVVDAALLAEAKKYEALADQATEPAEVERLERIAREQWAGHDAVRRLWLRASSAPPPSSEIIRENLDYVPYDERASAPPGDAPREPGPTVADVAAVYGASPHDVSPYLRGSAPAAAAPTDYERRLAKSRAYLGLDELLAGPAAAAPSEPSEALTEYDRGFTDGVAFANRDAQPVPSSSATAPQAPEPRCADCDETKPHIHCPECGATDHAAANCDMGG